MYTDRKSKRQGFVAAGNKPPTFDSLANSTVGSLVVGCHPGGVRPSVLSLSLIDTNSQGKKQMKRIGTDQLP